VPNIDVSVVRKDAEERLNFFRAEREKLEKGYTTGKLELDAMILVYEEAVKKLG
jgi:SMC interacting uncharacterized protein involved in chromosome segregation